MRRRVLLSVLLTCVLGTIMGLVATPAGANGLFHPIRNVGNSLCLQPAGGSTAEFTPVVQADCFLPDVGQHPEQGWFAEKVSGTRYHLVNQASGLCMNVFGPTANGTPILLVQCVTVSNEEFNTRTNLPDVVSLMSRAGNKDTNFCVDVPGAQSTRGLALQLFKCNNTVAQRFAVGLDLSSFTG